MKIFVINLPSSVARKEAIREAFRNLEVDLEFFEAVDGRKGLPSDLESLPDDKHRIYFRSRPLSPGEKGCYASHYKLWQKCVELNEPILILENDCFPTEHFTSVLAALPDLHRKGYEYLRLEDQHHSFEEVESFRNLKLVLWKDNRAGTRGYSLNHRYLHNLII